MSHHRADRVGDLIRAELSDLILREVRDPRVKLASVTGVDVTHDLHHARVRVSVLGSEAEREAAVTGLHNARGFLRSQLARRLTLRITPELEFKLDRGAEHSQHIADLLESLDAEREPT